MKVNVETVSKIEKKLSIEVDADRVAAELDRAYKGLSRQVKIPGFRPGKIPRHILESRYRDRVEQEVVQNIVERTYREAVDSHELFPVGSPTVSPDKLEEGKAFKYEARVEVKPELAAKDYKGLPFKPVTPAVTDEMVSAELARLQESLAQMRPIEDRQAATTGDYAVIDYVGKIDGTPFEGGEGSDVTVQVAEGTLLEGSAPMLAGVTLGEKAQAELEFPADYRDEALREKKATFEITLKELKAREVPALDDELAKDVGGEAKTLDELKAKLRTDLLAAETQRADRENRDQLIKALLEKNEVEVPRSMVERGIDLMMAGAAERFARQGLDIRQLGLDFQRLREDLREKATEEVKAALVLEAIAAQEKLEVGDEEIAAHYRKLAEEAGVPEARVRSHFEKEKGEKSGLTTRLREEKVLAMLKAEAKVMS